MASLDSPSLPADSLHPAMESEKRALRNQKRRAAYATMPESSKAALLQRKRALYASRKDVAQGSTKHPATAAAEPHQTTVSNCGIRRAQPSSSTNPSRLAYVNPDWYPSELMRPEFYARYEQDARLSTAAHAIASLLPDATKCTHCSAFRFYHEPPSFCCSQGQVRLASHEMPEVLRRVFTGADDEAIHFKRFVWSYNNNLEFTTFSTTTDQDLLKNTQGVYTVKVQGQIHHYLRPLIPTDGARAGLQLYFYNPDQALEEHLASYNHFSRDTMTKLTNLLASNPYAKFMRQLKDLPTLDACKLYHVNDPKLDQRVYNQPTCTDVSAIVYADDESAFNPRCHIQVYAKNNRAYSICHNYGCYDPSQYPLLFPEGHPGRHCGIEKLDPNEDSSTHNCSSLLTLSSAAVSNAEHLIFNEEEAFQTGRRKRTIVSCRQYYSYKFQIRSGDFSMVLHTDRLLLQYIVDMFIKIETSRLEYLYKNHKELRTECLQGLVDSIAAGSRNTSDVGKTVILPASFLGDPRDMKRRYMDAMALVQHFGKPEFFITMTCNPSWPEIAAHLLPGELPQNRPDLLSWVFKSKLEMLKRDIVHLKIFGKPDAYVYSIEFQKRGLPHAHLLLIVSRDSKPLSADAYDRFICAELPQIAENLLGMTVENTHEMQQEKLQTKTVTCLLKPATKVYADQTPRYTIQHWTESDTLNENAALEKRTSTHLTDTPDSYLC